MSGNGKAMRLIADLLNQMQGLIIGSQAHFCAILSVQNFPAGSALAPFCDAHQGDRGQLQLFHDVLRGSQLSFATVDQNQIR